MLCRLPLSDTKHGIWAVVSVRYILRTVVLGRFSLSLFRVKLYAVFFLLFPVHVPTGSRMLFLDVLVVN